MLERAATCLESGGRQLLRAPTPCLRSRRRLHTAFWHHGASDLALPSWLAASSMFDGQSGDVDDSAAKITISAAPRQNDGALLEFLYPEKTMALLKRLAVTSTDPKDSRRYFRRTHTRQYSTAPWQPPLDHPGVDDEELQEAKREAEEMLRARIAIKILPDFLKDPPPSKHQLAWQLYEAIPEAHLARGHWKMRLDLLEYLTAGDEPAIPSRVIQLFDQIPYSRRRPSSYRAAIVAYISLRMVGPAMQLLREVVTNEHYDMLYIGTDVILKRVVLDEQWPLCLEVFKLLIERRRLLDKLPLSTRLRQGNTLPDVWKGVAQLSGLRSHFDSFIGYVRQYRHELTATEQKKEILMSFARTFAPYVIEEEFEKYKTNDRHVNNFLKTIFKDMHELNLPTSTAYERAILGTLHMPRFQGYSYARKYWVDSIYERYRQLCLDSPTGKDRMKPSLNLLRSLISCGHYTLQKIETLIEDVRTFYPGQELGAGLVKDLVHIYADHGHVARVEELTAKLRASQEEELSIYTLSALPYVHARRADVEETLKQFNRIQEEFGHVPDIACWNILLLAYVRADDLDGALECFNACLDNGLRPDEYSFNTLLMLCADRGDVEAFEALFSRAKKMGVSLTGDVRARSGYVQAFLNAGDFEGAYAIAQGMLQSWKTGTLRGHPLTHTWNLLIQYHALDKDIASARLRYKEMVANKIPIDAWTYGSLMRALVEVKQSNAAYRILRKTMPSVGLRVDALHYAICMTGLLREGGDQLDLAVDVYNHMTERNISQTESSQEASFRVLGGEELRKLEKYKNNPKRRLIKVENLLEKVLVGALQGQNAHRQPSHTRFLDSRNQGALPQQYYGLLISLYTNRNAYAIIKKLIRRAQKAAPEAANFITPMTFIEATMTAHQKQGEHAEVARYWALARNTADKLTKTVRQAIDPEPPVSESDAVLDSSVFEQYEASRISNNRRSMLFKASRIYVRSLLDPSNPDPNALQEAQRTMRDLLVNGYTVDNFSWNEYVSTLAMRNLLLDAFSVCETFLMPGFPGWRDLHPNYIRRDQFGYRWIALRHDELRKSSVLPRYHTLVVLAAALRRVASEERQGVGYVAEERMWLSEILEQKAPMTVRAIQSMPRTADGLQNRMFHRRD